MPALFTHDEQSAAEAAAMIESLMESKVLWFMVFSLNLVLVISR